LQKLLTIGFLGCPTAPDGCWDTQLENQQSKLALTNPSCDDGRNVWDIPSGKLTVCELENHHFDPF
jgi:hypothetical protein